MIKGIRVLVTGFGKFPGGPLNPSQTIVETLKRNNWKPDKQCDIRYEVLETRFDTTQKTLKQLLENFKPDVVIQYGLAARGKAFRLEQKARNVVSQRYPDEAGKLWPQNTVIDGGPDVFYTTLPRREITKALTQKNLPVQRSVDAGEYVCNFSIYNVLHTIEEQKLDTLAGFIHIPFTKGQLQQLRKTHPELKNCEGMATRDLIRGAKTIIQTVIKHWRQS